MDTNNHFYGKWISEDKVFLFDFYAQRTEGDVVEASVSIFYLKNKPVHQILLCECAFLQGKKVDLHLKKDNFSLDGWMELRVEVKPTEIIIAVWAEIVYGEAKRQQCAFEGIQFIKKMEIEPKPMPIPPPPFPPNPLDPTLQPHTPSVQPIPYQDLFPYTYMRNWVDVEPQELKIHFFDASLYTSNAPADSFYGQLKTLKADANRDGMEKEAVAFLEGTKYEGAFIRDKTEMGAILPHFSTAVRLVQAKQAPQGFLLMVCQLAHCDLETLLNDLKSTDYNTIVQKSWSSYFALVIRLGYRAHWLDTLTETLIGVNVVNQLWDASSSTWKEADWDALLPYFEASILLPNDIFPLPPFQQLTVASDTAATSDAQNWVLPYAIGELQWVRQRLLRYEMGDIATIINVMSGEKKQILDKQVQKKVQKQKEVQSNTDTTVSQQRQQQLEQETQKVLQNWSKLYDYTKLQPVFSAPMPMYMNGSYSKTKGADGKPISKEKSSLARKTLQATTHQMTEKVVQWRTQTHQDARTHSEKTVWDNTQGKEVLTGVYRWLNQVYEAQVVHVGNRFILEGWISKPATAYLEQTAQLEGRNLKKPISLETAKIDTFQAIQRDNYAQLCATYQVKNVLLPPKETILVSEWIESTTNTHKKIEIPTGYEAQSYTLLYNVNPSGLELNGFIGQNAFTSASPSPNKGNLQQETGLVPLMATLSAPVLATPPQIMPSFMISVQITCVCSVTSPIYMEWQSKMYQKISEAYEALKTAYYQQVSSNAPTQTAENPAMQRKIIHTVLKQQMITTLRAATQQNLPPEKAIQPTVNQVNAPRYIQFLNDVIDWDEMAYTFMESNAVVFNPSSSDAVFTPFLQAESATIFVPIRPAFNQKLLYFLATGMIWMGQDALTGVLSTQIGLVNELKKVAHTPLSTETLVDQWEVKIPTALQILSKGTSNFLR